MKYMIILVITLTIDLHLTRSSECRKRTYKSGTVCVCNDDYCDTIEDVKRQPKGSFVMYTSNQEGERFAITNGTFSSARNPNAVVINATVKYQSIIGFGGAFTDSAGININSLNGNAKEKLLRSYFSSSGINYNIGRIPIAASDFSTHGYSYSDGVENKNLTHFALTEEDFAYKIPLIKKARRLSSGKLNLFGSAWAAPKWMKTNNEYGGYGFLKKNHYQTWANYHIKFLEAYQHQGITFWGLTTGNEPHSALPLVAIPIVGFKKNEQEKWILNNMGPTLRKSQFSKVKLIGHDDQRLFLPALQQQLADNLTRNYLDGIGIHWYFDRIIPASVISNFHRSYPELFLLGTEACEGAYPWQTKVVLGSWDRAESYAFDIIEDLKHFMGGWVDWNLALDLEGGPNYVKNFVDSPIIVNKTSGEFYKQPMFYALGHFSKFLPRDSKRVDITTGNDLEIVAFERPDYGKAIIILNKKLNAVILSLRDPNRGELQVTVSAKSINSIVYW